MLIPYSDDNSKEKVPVVALSIIAINIFVFIYLLVFYHGGRAAFFSYGAVPAVLLHHAFRQPVSPLLSIIFSLFMHSGFLHLIGNMVYFWIFSNKIEDELGHFRFLLFYFFCGFAAILIYSFIDSHSTRPLVGASGAVSGILGAYLLLFPGAKVNTILYLVVYVKKFKIPAFLVIGVWASLQFYGGLVSLFIPGMNNNAWFAHLGGFLVGLSTVRFWMPRDGAG